jgi:pimeloyl-ACP methyl ester carboxylesterase
MKSWTLTHVEANGLRFACIEEGKGPLVVLVHGFPDTAHTWDHVRPLIAAKGYRAVSPFLRGYHPTQVPAEDADQETIARDVLALITALGETEAVVIGHDWGASAAYGAAALDPSRVRKLVTVGIPHPAALAASRFAADDFAALPAIYRRWSPAWTPPPEEFAAIRACFAHRESLDAAMGYYRQLQFRPSESLRRRIAVPTVAFAGLHDSIVTPADYRGAKKMFEREYVVEEVPGGHFLHREHPDVFAERLLAHL